MPWLSKSSLIAKEFTQPEVMPTKIPVKKIKLDINPENTAADDEAQEQLNTARNEAQKIVAKAQKDAEVILEKARSEGFNQGYADGQKKAQKEYERLETELKANFKKITEQRLFELQQERQKILAELEPQIINFFEVSLQKLLGEIPDAAELFYRKWLGEAIKQFTEKNLPTIFVNPEEYAQIKEILEQNGVFNEVVLLTEPEIEPGTVLLKGQGNYVVSLAVFTEEILEKLRDGV